MKLILLSAVILLSVQSQARIAPYTGKTKTPNANYKQIYLVDGAKASDVEAFQGAIAGKEVYKCTVQKIGMNKSGTGAAMKNESKSE